MNLFKNQKIRLSVILMLGLLQIISVTITIKPYYDHLFYAVNLSYFLLGFLSIDWRQGLKNISWATIPAVFLIATMLTLIALLNTQIDQLFKNIEASLMLWGLILSISLPIFLFGFGFRYLVLQIAKRPTVNNQ